MPTAYLSLGSNQEPEIHLPRAVAELRARFGQVTVSSSYRTKAIGFDGPDFLNCAAVLVSDLDVIALNDWLHALENTHGRRRDQPRFSSRPLDIDIVFFDRLIFNGPGHLKIPRPELHHAFILKPLSDIAPDFIDPLSAKSLAELWSQHAQFTQPPQKVGAPIDK